MHRAACFCAVLFVAAHPVTGPADTEPVLVTGTPERLSVVAHDVPLREIVETVAAAISLGVHSNAPLDQRVTVIVREQPLPSVLRSMLRGYSHTLWFRADSTGTLSIQARGAPAGEAVVFLAQAVDADDIEGARAMMRSAVAGERIEATAVLGTFGDVTDRQQLAAALGDPDPAVREEAVEAISQFDDSIDLLAAALDDRNRHVRSAAIDVLAGMDNEHSARLLAPLLQSDDVGLRAEIVDALGDSSTGIARALLQQAQFDESSAIREAATVLLHEP